MYRKLILSVFALLLNLNSIATEWLTYYVYYETEYLQGTWNRTDILYKSKNKYLAVELYEDLFGSSESQLVQKFLSRLKEKKPMLYNWEYNLTFQTDTVNITSKEEPQNVETIKNEIVATLTFNNFKAVMFNFGDKSETLTCEDLTLPYFDLVPNQIRNTTRKEELIESVQTDKKIKCSNPLILWLAFSIILNLGLLFILNKNRMKN